MPTEERVTDGSRLPTELPQTKASTVFESRRASPSSSIVLDSSAIASVFFKDKFTDKMDKAIREFGANFTFTTMDVAYAEVGSVAWKSVVLFRQAYEPNRNALEQALDFINENCTVVSSKEMISEAFQIGSKYNIQTYDSMFLVLAKKLGANLLTTDERLCNKISGIKQLQKLTLLPR